METGTCPVCGRELGVMVPRLGDGSLVVMRVHNQRRSIRCAGSRKEPVKK